MAIWLRADGMASVVRPEDGRRFTEEHVGRLVGGRPVGYHDEDWLGKVVVVLAAHAHAERLPQNRQATDLAGNLMAGDVLLMTELEYAGIIRPGPKEGE